MRSWRPAGVFALVALVITMLAAPAAAEPRTTARQHVPLALRAVVAAYSVTGVAKRGTARSAVSTPDHAAKPGQRAAGQHRHPHQNQSAPTARRTQGGKASTSDLAGSASDVQITDAGLGQTLAVGRESAPVPATHPTVNPAPQPAAKVQKPSQSVAAPLVRALAMSLGLIPLGVALVLAICGSGLVVLTRRRAA